MRKSEKFWDRVSNKYDKMTEKYEETLSKTIENTQKHLNSSDVVLDYACGTGTITTEIADNVNEMHAIDISSKMIEAAQRKADERKIENIDFVQSTVFDKRYKKESFDVITAFSVLHFIEDTQGVVERINELLRPGGIFISSTPCMGETKKSPMDMFVFFLTKLGVVPTMKFFKVSELETSVHRGHFQIVETESFHGANNSQPEHFIVAKKI